MLSILYWFTAGLVSVAVSINAHPVAGGAHTHVHRHNHKRAIGRGLNTLVEGNQRFLAKIAASEDPTVSCNLTYHLHIGVFTKQSNLVPQETCGRWPITTFHVPWLRVSDPARLSTTQYLTSFLLISDSRVNDGTIFDAAPGRIVLLHIGG